MIDLYCERTGPGLWSEPVNAVTNLAYLVAAWALWRLAGRARPARPGGRFLAALAIAIAVGSGLFHTFATFWARLLDEAPIFLFQLSFLWLYSRTILRTTAGTAVWILAGLLGASLVGRQFQQALNGSLMYAPAFLLTSGLGVYHYRAQPRERFTLLAGAGVFAAAVSFRTMDNAVCSWFPLGTHFLWHVATATVLYFFGRGLLMSMPSAPQDG